MSIIAHAEKQGKRLLGTPLLPLPCRSPAEDLWGIGRKPVGLRQKACGFSVVPVGKKVCKNEGKVPELQCTDGKTTFVNYRFKIRKETSFSGFQIVAKCLSI